MRFITFKSIEGKNFLSPGCMFSGHDYEASWPGVIKAVNKFATGNGFSNIKHCDISCWCFIKQH